MKVFEVRSEEHGDDNKITEVVRYVTHVSDSLLAVTDHFARECLDNNAELKSVREVLTVSQQL